MCCTQFNHFNGSSCIAYRTTYGPLVCRPKGISCIVYLCGKWHNINFKLIVISSIIYRKNQNFLNTLRFFKKTKKCLFVCVWCIVLFSIRACKAVHFNTTYHAQTHFFFVCVCVCVCVANSLTQENRQRDVSMCRRTNSRH